MSVSSIYSWVIQDVVKNSHRIFAEEGVDESVLIQLQQAWEQRLLQSGVIQPTGVEEFSSARFGAQGGQSYLDTSSFQVPVQSPSVSQYYVPQTPEGLAYGQESSYGLGRPQPQLESVFVSCTKYSSKSLKGLSQPPISWAPPGAKQPTVAAGRKHEAPPADKMASPFKKPAPKNIAQTDGTNDEVEDARMKEAKKIDALIAERIGKQLDGGEDDEEEEEEEEEEEGDEGELTPATPKTPVPKTPKYEPGEEKDADDLSDPNLEESDDEPVTEHLVLCQFEKVTRVKNKRKCNLKDGIMNLNGRDYLFHKATGEFEW